MIIVGTDIKLNIRPVFIGFIHKYYYEGPCRFAEGAALTPEFDIMLNHQIMHDGMENCHAKLNSAEIKLLDPVYVERTDDWDCHESMFELISKNLEEVDLFFVNVNIGRDDIVLEIARRFKKPIAIFPDNNFSKQAIGAALSSRGCEAYICRTWTDLNIQIKALRVRKVLQNTNVLLCTRFNSVSSYSSVDTFNCLEKVTEKLGAKFRYINVHEFLDQFELAAMEGNYTTPGRITPNITPAELEEVNQLADELIANAEEVMVERKFLVNSLIAYLQVKKNLDLKDCNAFTAPCPDMCSTRRVNQMQFTMCLAHSLLNEQGIPSACEYDIDAVLSMMMLTNISGNAPFMGNTAPIPIENGKPILSRYMQVEEIDKIQPQENLYYAQHSVPGRKFKGLNKAAAKYGLKHFALDQGFGAVMRYDFTQDIGQPITLARFSPDASKLFVGKGVIVGGGGYDLHNCNGYVVYRVADQDLFYECQLQVGNHIPLVYGDFSKELMLLGKYLNLEVITA